MYKLHWLYRYIKRFGAELL